MFHSRRWRPLQGQRAILLIPQLSRVNNLYYIVLKLAFSTYILCSFISDKFYLKYSRSHHILTNLNCMGSLFCYFCHITNSMCLLCVLMSTFPYYSFMCIYGLEQLDCFQMPTLRFQYWVFSAQDHSCAVLRSVVRVVHVSVFMVVSICLNWSVSMVPHIYHLPLFLC